MTSGPSVAATDALQTAPATLRLRWPLGLTFVLAALLLAAFGTVCELVSRTEFARTRLPIPSVGTGQPQLDKKLELLDEMVRRSGPVECLFLGSSQTYRSIDPAVFEQTFRTESGRGIRSFNFGINGVAEMSEASLATILIGRFHPKLIVVGVSSYGLDRDKGARFDELLSAGPWFRHHQGRFTVDGWFIEHSHAFRRYLGWTFWTHAWPGETRARFERAVGGMTPAGFARYDSGEFRGLGEEENEALKRYDIDQAHLESLSRLLSLRSGAGMLLVEIPVHESVLDAYARGREDNERAFAAIERIASERGVELWRYPDDLAIPPDGWADFAHLNQAGAERYSRWLGERLGEAVRTNRLSLPTD